MFVGVTTTSNGAMLGGSQKPLSSCVLLDARGQDALHADAVAAHDRRHFLAVLVEHARAHRLRVLVAQLEDVADLDRFADFQRLRRIRAAFALDRVAQVGRDRRLEVAARRDVAQVIVQLVRAADQVRAAFQRASTRTVNPRPQRCLSRNSRPTGPMKSRRAG